MMSKVEGWKQKLLTQAGCESLIKAMAQAIPTYPMSGSYSHEVFAKSWMGFLLNSNDLLHHINDELVDENAFVSEIINLITKSWDLSNLNGSISDQDARRIKPCLLEGVANLIGIWDPPPCAGFVKMLRKLSSTYCCTVVGLQVSGLGVRLVTELIYRRWLPPLQATLKLNVDATWDKKTLIAGLGAVIRDEHGRYIKGAGMEKCSLFDSCFWKWIPRQANKAVDVIALEAKRKMCDEVWISRPPSSLVFILQTDGFPCPPQV
ncbi:PREDICTED: LOC18784793 [Prunus dulcis]|uniref:PREDICTED: LOC18784793 n=1 Tax=Prunus dulcis TaxID=3755 RepID=A0A5E4FNX8_PRUDU|nr:PREDICTED: LOC18784793 [Prunus dulcis]